MQGRYLKKSFFTVIGKQWFVGASSLRRNVKVLQFSVTDALGDLSVTKQAVALILLCARSGCELCGDSKALFAENSVSS